MNTLLASVPARRFVRLGLAVAAAMIGAFAPIAHARPSAGEIPFAGLVVVPEPNLRLTGRNQADHDLGRLSSLDRPQVEHRFTLRNESAAPLTVTALEPSCHCTAAIVEKIDGREPAPSPAFIHQLPPRREMVVKVSVQLARQLSGPMSHGVAIRVAEHESPVARLSLSGEMAMSLMITPTELDFGPMKRGQAHTRTIIVACDPRLLSADALPPLEAQHDSAPDARNAPLITIVPQPSADDAPAAAPAARSGEANPALCVRSYVVTVRPRRTGELTARIGFVPPSPADYRGTIPYERAREAFGGIQIFVSGEVTKK